MYYGNMIEKICQNYSEVNNNIVNQKNQWKKTLFPPFIRMNDEEISLLRKKRINLTPFIYRKERCKKDNFNQIRNQYLKKGYFHKMVKKIV